MNLFIERNGRWFYWWEVKKEVDAIPERDLKDAGFLH